MAFRNLLFNHFLESLEKELVHEYDKVLEEEEIIWYQKSRMNWSQNGDKSTKFFYSMTLTRRRRNKIESLIPDNNVRCNDAIILKVTSQNYFQKQYIGEDEIQEFPEMNWTTISEDQVQSLIRSVTMEETTNALLSMNGNKSPGPDMGDGKIPEGLNQTFISLIPKLESAQRISEFRPMLYVMYCIS